jgi:hypothetical protein
MPSEVRRMLGESKTTRDGSEPNRATPKRASTTRPDEIRRHSNRRSPVSSDSQQRRTGSGEALLRYLDAGIIRRRRRELGLDRFGRPTRRSLGTNARALGTNPRSLGTNPRSRRGVRDLVDDGRTLGEVQLGRELGWAA